MKTFLVKYIVNGNPCEITIGSSNQTSALNTVKAMFPSSSRVVVCSAKEL